MYIRKQAVGNDSGGEVAFQNQNECYMQQKSCGTRYVLSPDVTEEEDHLWRQKSEYCT